MIARWLHSGCALRTGVLLIGVLLAAVACEVPPDDGVGPVADTMAPRDVATAADVEASDSTPFEGAPDAADVDNVGPDLPTSTCRHPDAVNGYVPRSLTVSSRAQLLQLEGCESILALSVENAEDVYDLLPLEALTRVERQLRVTSTPNLVDLRGLRNLREVGDGLMVFDNAALEAVALDALGSVGLDPDLEPSLRVEGNAALQAVVLPALTAVGGALTVQAVLTDPESARPTVELPLLASVGTTLRLDVTNALDLPALESVGRDLDLLRSTVESFSFAKLRSIGGALVLPGDDHPASEILLPSLSRLGTGWFHGLAALDLRALDTVDGDLGVEYLDASMFDLPALVEVGGTLAIQYNLVLTALDLPLLSTVRADLYLWNNPELPQDVVDEIVAHVDVGGKSVTTGNLP